MVRLRMQTNDPTPIQGAEQEDPGPAQRWDVISIS